MGVVIEEALKTTYNQNEMTKKKPSENEIRALLKRYFSFDEFKEPQQHIISDIMSGRDVLAVLGTGAGKSLCYQLPAIHWASQNKTTVVIEPVLALMNNQCHELNAHLERSNAPFKAVTINSQTTQEELADFGKNRDKYKIIYVSPEKFSSTSFGETVLKDDLAMIVVDEAHCVSLWGHDFRTSYSKIGAVIKKRFNNKRPVIAAFTATATVHVKKDIVELLGLKVDADSGEHIYKGRIIRDNLNLITHKKSSAYKFRFIKKYVESKQDELGIIYCNTKSEVRQIRAYLSSEAVGIDCATYFGVSDDADPENLENSEAIRKQNAETMERFYNDEKLSCVVATTAFGMGIDKSKGRDVTYVINFSIPRSPESFYQETGRAGRHTDRLCDCILLYDKEDVKMLKSWVESNPEYIVTGSEYKLALDRINKMEEYAKLGSRDERNAFLEVYFDSYIPPFDSIEATKKIYLNRSKLGWYLIKPENLKDEEMPDEFDVMVLDAINSHIIDDVSGFTYLDILRTLSGKDYFDSKSPLQDEVIEAIEKFKKITVTLDDDKNSKVHLTDKNTFRVSARKRGVILNYNENSPSPYFDERAIYYRMPSAYLGLPDEEQRKKYRKKGKDIKPMPQTKEGLMIKYYLLSKITYARFLNMNYVRDESYGRKLINPGINLSNMLYELGVSFPNTPKGDLEKKKRLFEYTRDYLEALKDYKYIEGYTFGKTKRCPKNTLFLIEKAGNKGYNEYNTVSIDYKRKYNV